MPTEQDSSSSDQGPEKPPRDLCEACLTAFASDPEVCPRCDSQRPDDGWRRLRNFPDVWLGRTISERYRLLQRLGTGTFGSVYRAKRPHLPDNYAVKIIDLNDSQFGAQGPSLRDRVEREVRILSSISTPHLVSFHDVLELPGGSIAVVMDYVQGETLGQLLDRTGPLSVSRAVQFAIEIAAGLRAVHERGVVHRDLKPDNIMIQNMGGRREFVEIIDFGIARFEHETSETVGFIGTPRYTSPEQAQGTPSDRTSDIYNLGMLLFHMLVGQPPFNQQNATDLLAAHSRQQAPPLSQAADSRQIPPALDRLVGSMLCKDPDDRPAEIGHVLDILQPLRHRLEESEPSDSSEPRPGTGNHYSLGASHRTSDHQPVGSEPATDFADRPPSDVYQVTDPDSFYYRDDQNRIRRRHGSRPTDEVVADFSDEVTALTLTGDATLLVGREAGGICRLSPESGVISEIDAPDGGAVADLAESPGGHLLVVGFADGAVAYQRRDETPATWHTLPAGGPVGAVAAHQDGTCLAVGRHSRQTEIYILSRTTDDPVTQIHHRATPEHLEFSQDGYLLAVRFGDDSAKLYSALTGAHVGDAPQSVLQASSVFDETDG
jgi:serine/threonine-protein kinase